MHMLLGPSCCITSVASAVCLVLVFSVGKACASAELLSWSICVSGRNRAPAQSSDFATLMAQARGTKFFFFLVQVPNLAYEIVQRQRGMRDSKRLMNLQGFLVGARPRSCMPSAYAL